MKRSRHLLGLPTILAIAALAGCDGSSGSGDAGVIASGADPAAPLFQMAESAPWTTRYAGVRRVESHVIDETGNQVDLAYREEVAADGNGNFTIRAIEALSYVPNEEAFLLKQDLRESFLYRYRDFQIRDLARFYANYVAVDLGQSTTIAGRSASVYLIERNEPGSSSYTVGFDDETGLVLRYEERDISGVLTASMEFESFDADPDLSGAVWSQPTASPVSFDVSANLSSQTGFDVLEPAVLPTTGYFLWKAHTLLDYENKTWMRLTYTDGVEPLFFFHTEKPVSLNPDVLLPGDGKTTDEVWVYSIGAVQVVQGRVRGRDMLALGRVSGDELLDVVESAIP